MHAVHLSGYVVPFYRHVDPYGHLPYPFSKLINSLDLPKFALLGMIIFGNKTNFSKNLKF